MGKQRWRLLGAGRAVGVDLGFVANKPQPTLRSLQPFPHVLHLTDLDPEPEFLGQTVLVALALSHQVRSTSVVPYPDETKHKASFSGLAVCLATRAS